jgi:hypothetical protein
VTAKDLLPFADEIVPEEGKEGKKTERSRVTSLGGLLRRRVGATFEIEGSPDYYLKIESAKVERTEGGTHAGYALKTISKTNPRGPADPAVKVGEVGGVPKNASNHLKIKENFSANLSTNLRGGV